MRHISWFFAVALFAAGSYPVAVGAADGTAKGEATDEKGQQGLGLHSGSESSNVIKGGPEIIEGKITGIRGGKIFHSRCSWPERHASCNQGYQ